MKTTPKRLREVWPSNSSRVCSKSLYFAIRGTPSQALLKQAEKYYARVIVVGNKRMQGLGRVLGSITSSLAHNAPCDVYIAQTDS